MVNKENLASEQIWKSRVSKGVDKIIIDPNICASMTMLGKLSPAMGFYFKVYSGQSVNLVWNIKFHDWIH